MKIKDVISNRSIPGILFRLFGSFVLKLISKALIEFSQQQSQELTLPLDGIEHGGLAMYIASSTLHIRSVPGTNVIENGGSRSTVHFALINFKINMYKYLYRFGFLELNQNNNPFPWLFFFSAFTSNVKQNGLRCKAQNTIRRIKICLYS